MVQRLPSSSPAACLAATALARATAHTLTTLAGDGACGSGGADDARTGPDGFPHAGATAHDHDFQPPLHPPFRSAMPEHVAVFSPGGSQGGAFAAQALRNAARGGYQVTLHARDPERFRRDAVVRCGAVTVDTAGHPRARVSSGLLAVDPARTLVIDPTLAGGLPDTIARTPVGSVVAYAQNGMPTCEASKRSRSLESHTLVSMVSSSRRPGGGVTVAPGGTLLVGEDDRCIDAFHQVLRDQGFFALKTVPDIEAARYEKIALNCALNVTATLFGEPLGALLQRMRCDRRCAALIGGLAAEVCAVAAAQGLRIRPADQVIAGIQATMERFPGHPTSMRAAFDAGLATEIDVLNAGVARLGRSLRIATPLNDLVCDRLAAFEALRERDGPAASADTGGFHRRHAAVVALAVEELLQAAARLA